MPRFGPARAIPVVSDVDHSRLVGTAYASENGDIVITVSNEDWKKEVGAYFSIAGAMQFMLGCQYKPGEKYDELTSTAMRIRMYFVEFSESSRVLINSPGNKHDGRVGRVFEVNADATLQVAFESGPGDVVATFKRHELTKLGDVPIKFPSRES